MNIHTTLVLGTHNQHKKKEVAKILAPWRITLQNLADYPSALEVPETGSTFSENARQKASVQAKHLSTWVLAEDSGLAVDALGGQPGVFSARYSGEGANDIKNNSKLLENLKNVPPEKRTAKYVCHFSLSDPSGNIRAESEAYCYGRILLSPEGNNGFGYDPLFEIIEYHRPFGILSPELKSLISHRARALRALIPDLVTIFSE
ncbi:MAG: RdgB/HAM1 family non-canonical purine NTP pyrophosphatase [Planctomycetia bacterium]|nr:RdgB/HAM1 family non-canonical purine NTP pyrophosphatase [Planctomycetia bacterium]